MVLLAATMAGCTSTPTWRVSNTAFLEAPMQCNQVSGHGLAHKSGKVWGGNPEAAADDMIVPNERRCAVGSVTIQRIDPSKPFTKDVVNLYVAFTFRYPGGNATRWVRYHKEHNGANQVTFDRVIFTGGYNQTRYDDLKEASTPEGVKVYLGHWVGGTSGDILQWGNTDGRVCVFHPASNLYPACP